MESLKSLTLYFDARLWRIFLLGIASGFPWLLIGSGLTAWLTDNGISRSEVGLIGVVFVAYAINFLWAPLIDHLQLPFLRRLGHRKSWIVLCLAVLIGLAVLLSVIGPVFGLLLMGLNCLAISITSATQDLAIDAYRITVIREDETHLLGPAAAMATSGWWVGFSLPGTFAFLSADIVGWPSVYLGLAGILGVILILVLWLVVEPPRTPHRLPKTQVIRPFEFFDRSYVAAVVEFFTRNGIKLALTLLGFIFLFKLGEAFLGRMVIVFYKEIGFTNADIGIYSQAIGLAITLTCSIIAGFFMSKFGTIRGLLIAGVAMASTNLLFSVLAIVGPDKQFLLFALIADGITSAFSTVAFVAFITSFTNHLHAASQYGALASLGNASRTLLAATSGILVDALGGNWALFFVLTAVMVLPALALLGWVGFQVKRLNLTDPSQSSNNQVVK